MGQKASRQRCVARNENVMASPVFHVEKVRNTKGSFVMTSRYHINRTMRNDYRVERNILGSGASGPVHLATRGNRKYAVKSFRKKGLTAEAKRELRGEVEVYLQLDHPHVARLEDVYETDRDLHLVMELMSGGELYARLAQRKQYSEADAAKTCRQMLLAVAYLHAHNIVHRDLKLENFLYERQDTEHLKLIDFGFAKYHARGSGKMSRSCGSLHYIAPEVLRHSYDEKADVWSLGVIVYMLLTGNPPFFGSTDEKCLSRIQKGEPSFSKRWFKLSGGAQTFVLSLLALDPEARPSATEAMKRPWLCAVEMPKATIDGEVLASLRSFTHASHFRRACLSMMAWSLTLEDQTELRQQFQFLDSDKTGTISQKELANVLKANFNVDSAETETLFRGLDTKGDKKISYAEFLAAAMQKRIQMHEDVLHKTFERFDVDGQGEITASNLRSVLGDSFEGSDVETLIREADFDGDGRLSYNDFFSYLRGDVENNSNVSTQVREDVPGPTPNSTPSRSPPSVKEWSWRFRARRGCSSPSQDPHSRRTTRQPLTPKHLNGANTAKPQQLFSDSGNDSSTTCANTDSKDTSSASFQPVEFRSENTSRNTSHATEANSVRNRQGLEEMSSLLQPDAVPQRRRDRWKMCINSIFLPSRLKR